MMGEPEHCLEDDSPLITAAQLGKLRLVRLLLEGGAQVNERNQRGETPLLAACKAMCGSQQASSPSLKLIQYLLEHRANPNSQDKAGRTALMYSCLGRAGPEVASSLVRAGADPSLEDYVGASSLVYAINSRDQATVQVLLDACREGGRDIIIIATELDAEGASITRRYLNVVPSPDSSPVSCTSPSEIELKAGLPGSEAEAGGSMFNFRAARDGKDEAAATAARPYAHRLCSAPALAVPNPAHLRTSCAEGLRRQAEKGYRCFLSPEAAGCGAGRRWSLHTLSEAEGSPAPGKLSHGTSCERLPHTKPPLLARRNTLPALQDAPLLQLPCLPLPLGISEASLQPQPQPLCPPVPPDSPLRWRLQEPPHSLRPPAKVSFLPPLSKSCSITAAPLPSPNDCQGGPAW